MVMERQGEFQDESVGRSAVGQAGLVRVRQADERAGKTAAG